MVHLDIGIVELGFAPDERGSIGSLRKKPSEVEKAKFEADIWSAFAQCFLTYEEAIHAISDFNFGIPA